MGASGLVGRERERDLLAETLTRLRAGTGGLVLVAGDAGAGKTTLVETVLGAADVPVLRGAAHAGGSVPYGPLLAAIGDRLPPEGADDLPQAIRRSLEASAVHQPTVVFLDDLQWADAATLAVLADPVGLLAGLPLLVIGAYRTDELSLRHPVRALRATLRRASGIPYQHVRLGPLDEESGAILVRRVLGDDAAPEVVATIHTRAHGLPFYLEELATAVAEAEGSLGAAAPTVDVPESVRDAVLLRVSRLSERAQVAAEVVAAAGAPVRLDVLAEVADDEAVDELLEAGLLVELGSAAGGPGEAGFRHALVGEALHAATPWARRRRHHAALAPALELQGVPPALVAHHRIEAGEPDLARPLLLAAAEDACNVHAYRDAKDAIDQALTLWPSGMGAGDRLRIVDRLGECAERCGEFADAAAAWEEVAAARLAAGDHEALARVQRRLAGVYEMVADWSRALAARALAAEEFGRAGLVADAAGERLTAAVHLESAGDLTGALGLVQRAWADLEDDGTDAGSSAVGPHGVRVRAMSIEGHIRACLGEGEAGVELTRRALDLVLGSDLEELAAEVYSLHAYALEQATDYAAGLDTLTAAVSFCRTRGLDSDAHVCLACLTPALRHTGQWGRAIEVGREVLATDDAPEVARMVASGEVGLVLANQGKTGSARRYLARAAAFARTSELFGLEIETSWGLARVHELDGDDDAATARLRELSARCRVLDDRHYSVAALRWAASFFGRRGLRSDLGACTDALARIASATGTAEATGALAHALGEVALLEDDPRRAADQFERTLELLESVTLPPETAETQLRAGVALVAAGDHEKAVERLVAAHHTARTLGARPLAAATIAELERMGEDVARHVGRRAARQGDAAGLTPRELEVVRLVAEGLTNRQIAAKLFLSPRTVDMHVRNLFTKLGCRTRTEAVRRVGELGLLETAVT